jgi:putative hydrolase of the HAD superfamily
LEQESKIARSNLAEHFQMIEVVSKKDTDVYRQLLEKYAVDPRRFLMVGNSLPSDILPVLALGGRAVHIPHHVTWAHETAELQGQPNGFFEAEHVGQLPRILDQIEAKRT